MTPPLCFGSFVVERIVFFLLNSRPFSFEQKRNGAISRLKPGNLPAFPPCIRKLSVCTEARAFVINLQNCELVLDVNKQLLCLGSQHQERTRVLLNSGS
ncbi:hypothetical protein GOP47_0021070 [Adiantum capillus-veneris]|uniref:Uncharacterized protein n=1 Tax=Adiantum capillus-veneris TaxID=13818 RepID=A0A9D4UAM2_ADICA|nr:hypothetical protein GOP47_0021070 [Adiantum capillus-veneris]